MTITPLFTMEKEQKFKHSLTTFIIVVKLFFWDKFHCCFHQVLYTRREANCVAHYLTKSALFSIHVFK